MGHHDTTLVLTAFEKFTEASEALEGAYHRLAEQFRSLSRELEETNERLQRTVDEKERIGSYLRGVLESLESGVLVADRDGRITHSNAAAFDLLFRASTGGTDGTVGGGGSARIGAQSRYGTLRSIQQARPEIEAALDYDGPARYETTLVDVETGEDTCLSIERRDLKAVPGETGGAVFVIRDLTELRALEHQAQRMERLAAMGEMALELAHEIRNPLGGIRLHASLLASEDELGESSRELLAHLEVGLHSLDTVVTNMLNFGCPQTPHRRDTNLCELVEEVEGFLRPLTRERGVSVDLDFSEGDVTAFLDREQLRQVLLNLWLNALNAMPQGGRLGIALTRDDEDAYLTFADTGPGLPAEMLDRAFDPFFTADRRGTGLGLAVVSQIVRNHGGDIRVESEAGKGATFRLTLPMYAEETCAVTS
jgi:signal transduction histidine kinase